MATRAECYYFSPAEGKTDALVQTIDARGPILLQYDVSATCKVNFFNIFTVLFILSNTFFKVLVHVMTRPNWVAYRDGNSIYSRDEGASRPSSRLHHLEGYVLGNDLPVEWIISVEQVKKNVSCNVTWIVFSRPAKLQFFTPAMAVFCRGGHFY